MKFSRLFNRKAAIVLLFGFTAAVEKAPELPVISTLLDTVKSLSETSLKRNPATEAARQMLIKTDPSFTTMFEDPTVSVVDRPQGKDRLGNFLLSYRGERIISIYEHPILDAAHSALINAHTEVTNIHPDEANLPSLNEFKTMSIAVTLANEAAHYWQSKADDPLVKNILYGEGNCADRLAVEQSSDAFMLHMAAKMYNNLDQTQGPEAERLKMALTWVMNMRMDGDFTVYAKKPSSPDALNDVQKFLTARYKEYENRHGCEKAPATQSQSARNAVKIPAKIMSQ